MQIMLLQNCKNAVIMPDSEAQRQRGGFRSRLQSTDIKTDN